ncbi:unnamed protein product [Phytomonas sp. EM1]|nr:unnamed protein product [Phytomonas sp. EM1]|eukprot:CCW64765.1 unnamed protein product [Phytomonas sp. isolate EM1]
MTVLAGHFLFDTYRSRRNHDLFFSPAAVQHVEEHARYACTALKGMDVVVRNYYLRKPAPPVAAHRFLHNSTHLTQAASVDDKALTDVDKGSVAFFPLCSSFFSEIRNRLHRFMLLFSNETHTVVSSSLRYQCPTSPKGEPLTESSSPISLEGSNSDCRSCDGNLSQTRIIVQQQTVSSDLGTCQTDAKLEGTGYHFGMKDNKLSSDDTSPRQELVASAGWPPFTEKYVSLSLESHKFTSGVCGDNSNGGVANDTCAPSDTLRRLVHRATHQSLVRCLPLSIIPGTNCEADPSYLGADYLRIMLSAFLLLPSSLPPMRVGILGVGGGSLPLFLLHYFSRSIHCLDLVDLEPMCIRAAVQDLGFWDALNQHGLALGSPEAPEGEPYSGSPLTKVHLEDAASFLRKHQGQISGLSLLTPYRPMNGTPTASTQAVPAPVSSSSSSTEVRFSDAEPPISGPSSASSSIPPSRIVEKAKLLVTPSRLPLPSLSKRTRARPFDILFVDLFMGSDLADGVASAEFLTLCRSSLSSYGVVAFNLPARDRPFVQQCQRIFGDANTYLIPCPSSANVIVLARGGSVSAFTRERSGERTVDGALPAPRLSHRVLYRRAMELSQRHSLPYDLSAHYPVWWRFW